MQTTYVVRQPLRIKTSKGVVRYQPGETITVSPGKVKSLVVAGKLSAGDPAGMIAAAIHEIEGIYIPSALSWAQRERPKLAGKMKDLEGKINSAAKAGNIEELKDHLSQWRQTIQSIVYTFYALETTK